MEGVFNRCPFATGAVSCDHNPSPPDQNLLGFFELQRLRNTLGDRQRFGNIPVFASPNNLKIIAKRLIRSSPYHAVVDHKDDTLS